MQATSIIAFAACCALAASARGAGRQSAGLTHAGQATGSDVPDLSTLRSETSILQPAIERFDADLGSLNHAYTDAVAPSRFARLTRLYSDWLTALDRLDFNALSSEDRVDYLLFKNQLRYASRKLSLDQESLAAQSSLLPFRARILELTEALRRMEPVDPAAAALTLRDLRTQVTQATERVEGGAARTAKAGVVSPTVANRAAGTVEVLRTALKRWFDFYNGYDPMFTWWADEPWQALDKSLAGYAAALREKVGGVNPANPNAIVGNPIGREALTAELQHEMIPYTPEELIAIATKEYAWCESEMKRASNEMGFGDDWRKALEKVKSDYVPPGKQPEMIRDLAAEAVQWVTQRRLVTIPRLARDTWTMRMMSPEEQLVSPFFLGGDTIIVSYPTDTMTEDQKLMSMRANNVHFARATVFHELIPGHRLQEFMERRYRAYRRLFGTPFWTEGWAFYWEMLLYARGFPRSPEDRIGMLFWRMHRCARVIFSLSFHLGKMTPQQCIDYLVEKVGHERASAEAEVRRSFNGSYSPLYQCAYLVGALQFWALHHELVDSGKMTDRAFHDAVLRENNIPVEMVRAILTHQPLSTDYVPSWRFYGEAPDVAGPPAAAPATPRTAGSRRAKRAPQG